MVSHKNKNWWKSKTLWFNVVTTLALGLELLTDVPVLNPEALVLVGGLVNVVLRVWFTNTGLK